MAVEHGIFIAKAVEDRLYSAHRLISAWGSLFEDELVECDLGYRTTSSLFAAIARFDKAKYTPEVRTRFSFWAARAGATNFALTELRESERAIFMRRFDQSDVKQKSVSPSGLLQALDSVWTSIGVPPDRRRMPRVLAQLELDLGKDRKGVTYDAAEGGLFVLGSESPPQGDLIELALTVPGTPTRFELSARVTHARGPKESGPGKPAGFGLAFSAPPEKLVMALSRHFGDCPVKPNIDDRRTEPRHPVQVPVKIATQQVVRLKYDTPAELSADYVQNLSVGGAFVRTSNPPPFDTPVTLEIQLPGGAVLSAAARVVHVTSVGMGVQFTLDSAKRQSLAAAIARLTAPRKRGLVFAHDAAFGEALQKHLSPLGFEVRQAESGSIGLHVIFEELSSLEVVVVDLDQPQPSTDADPLEGGALEAETLVEVIRKAAGEKRLTIVAVGQDVAQEVQTRLRELGVNQVVDKRSGAASIAKQIANL